MNVRVVLDQHLEKARNLAAYNYLAAHRVHVRWGPAGVTYHQKTLTVDNATSVIMTLNLVAADYPGTRDFAVIDTGRADVAAIVVTFDADFGGRAITPPDGADLVWSPATPRPPTCRSSTGPGTPSPWKNEEMGDPAVTAALAADARRGVDVTDHHDGRPRMGSGLRPAGPGWRAYPALRRQQRRPVHPCQGDRRRRRPGRPGGGGRVAELLGPQLRLQPGAGHPHQRPGSRGGHQRHAHQGLRRVAPYTPAASRPAGTRPSGAWCTATASVYNADGNENDVYVHSNQPGQSATATAGRYSHTYQTNGSGYALIYLNGPPPGTRITVTVGGATCTTSN